MQPDCDYRTKSGGGGGGGGATLDGWTFGAGSVFGSDATTKIFNNTYFLCSATNVTLSGTLNVIAVGDNETLVSSGSVSSVSISAYPDPNSIYGSVSWNHSGTFSDLTVNVSSSDSTAIVSIFAPNQVASFELSVSVGDSSTFSFQADSLVTFNLSSIGGGAYSVFFSGPFNTSCVDSILQTILSNGASSAVIVIYGSSASPTILPETDTVSVSNPVSGNSFQLSTFDGVSSTVLFSDAVDLESSTTGGSFPAYTILIGIQDSPSDADIADKISSYWNTQGFSSTPSGSNISVVTPYAPSWPLSFSGTGGTMSNTQMGMDRVYELVQAGNSVTTN